jgi:hypothetical protein
VREEAVTTKRGKNVVDQVKKTDGAAPSRKKHPHAPKEPQMRLRAATPPPAPVEGRGIKLRWPDLGRDSSLPAQTAAAGATSDGPPTVLLPPPRALASSSSSSTARDQTQRLACARTTTSSTGAAPLLLAQQAQQRQQQKDEVERSERAVLAARGGGGYSGSSSGGGQKAATVAAALAARDVARASLAGWRVAAAFERSSSGEEGRGPAGSGKEDEAATAARTRRRLEIWPRLPPPRCAPAAAQHSETVCLTRAQRREAGRVAAVEMVWRTHRHVLLGGGAAEAAAAAE